MHAGEALDLVLRCEFDTVLDVGCGDGVHVSRFVEYGKKVTACDIFPRLPHHLAAKCHRICTTLEEAIEDGEQFDLVWCSHTLEHQLDLQTFLLKLKSATRNGALLAITVPPLKHDIVGGHVSLWNAGLLLYRLVLAGLDCRDAKVKQYGYNISVVVRKQPIALPALTYDNGDLRRLSDYFPVVFSNDSFRGDIQELNWG